MKLKKNYFDLIQNQKNLKNNKQWVQVQAKKSQSNKKIKN